MAKLVKLFEKYNVSTYDIYDIKNIEELIEDYIENGGSIKSSKINRILNYTHHIDFNPIFAYEILLRYGYKFKNNCIIASIIHYIIISTERNYNKFVKLRFNNLLSNSLVKEQLDKTEIIITDNDIDEAMKILNLNNIKILIEFEYYPKNWEYPQIKYPELIFKLERHINAYNFVFHNDNYKYLINNNDK